MIRGRKEDGCGYVRTSSRCTANKKFDAAVTKKSAGRVNVFTSSKQTSTPMSSDLSKFIADARESVDDSVFKPNHKSKLHCSQSNRLLKSWQAEATLTKDHLLYPVFVLDVDKQKTAINALPGQYRWSVDMLPELLDPLVKLGLQSVLLFGVLTDESVKDPRGSFASSDKNPVVRACKFIREKYPLLTIVCDVCLCAYTNHGHCGLIREDLTINNEPSIQRIAEVAVAYAVAGAHVVAPSDMMDGRIGAIKTELKRIQLGSKVAVMSYSAKFASCYYGPFREAAGSGMKFGDRSGYQLPPFSRQMALRAIDRDIEEGADMVMVKPGGPYLDIVRECRDRVNVPVAIYQVSGEYAMLYHAATAGAFNLKEAVLESLVCMRRAGATILISYFTPLVLEALSQSQ